MSGLDIVARGMGVAAQAAMPRLFADLEGAALPRTLLRVDTVGHTTSGLGAAVYVNDALCDAALAAKHPRFVFTAADGRVFRLLPDFGSVSVEQGGAAGDGVANDQPAVQATIDYVEAIDAREVVFSMPRYAIWATVRTSPRASRFELDGRPIVVTKTISLRGASADRSVLDFRGLGGVDPETNWQVVPDSEGSSTNAVWRGGGIFLFGNMTEPEDGEALNIERFEMGRLVLQGNRERTGNSNTTASLVTGDGWDTSDKGISIHDTWVGDLVISDCEVHGFKGELFFIAGADARSLHAERLHLHTTNGNAWNAGTNIRITADNCEFGNALIAHEDTGKTFARYTNCVWRDASTATLGSGPTNGILHNYLYPTRDETESAPMTQLEGCVFKNIGQLLVGCWTRGSIRTIDTQVYFSTPLYSALRDIDLEIEAWMDQRGNFSPVSIGGPANLTTQVSGAPAGTYQVPPRNMRIYVRTLRTAVAKAAGREWIAATWTGYVEPTCRIIVEGEANKAPYAINPVSMPKFDLRDYNSTHVSAGAFNGAHSLGWIDQNLTVVPSAVHMGYYQSAGTAPREVTVATEPAAGYQYGFAHGQKIRFYAFTNGPGIRFVKGTAGLRLSQTRTLVNKKDWIEFTFDKYDGRAWEESGFFSSADPV